MTTATSLQPLTTDNLSAYTGSRLRHLTNGAPLHIPGTSIPGFQPHYPARLYRHPYSQTQMPLLAGAFHTLTPDDQTWLISLANLAHSECPACQGIWTETADCLDVLPADAPLFRTQLLGTHYLLLRHDDQP
ncbi:hypothetical protein ABQE48_21675 [Mycolicibacterium thermoresistibile]